MTQFSSSFFYKINQLKANDCNDSLESSQKDKRRKSQFFIMYEYELQPVMLLKIYYHLASVVSLNLQHGFI